MFVIAGLYLTILIGFFCLKIKHILYVIVIKKRGRVYTLPLGLPDDWISLVRIIYREGLVSARTFYGNDIVFDIHNITTGCRPFFSYPDLRNRR